MPWECFYDMSYFDQWAIRKRGDKAFTSTIHVATQKEAQFLTNMLNRAEKAAGAYQSGYRAGWNDALDEVQRKLNKEKKG